jgi:hypothetical protein
MPFVSLRIVITSNMPSGTSVPAKGFFGTLKDFLKNLVIYNSEEKIAPSSILHAF